MVRVSYSEIDDIYLEIKDIGTAQTCSILILVAYEVDAMSSARMLMQHLRSDNIAYAMRPVSNRKQMKQVYESSLTSDIRSVILINCGAIYNLPRLFNLEQGGDQRIFVLDNHRPFHLANIYSRHNVVVFDDVENVESNANEIPSDGSILSAIDSSSESSSSAEDAEVNENFEEMFDDEDDVENLEGEAEEEADLDDDSKGSDGQDEENAEEESVQTIHDGTSTPNDQDIETEYVHDGDADDEDEKSVDTNTSQQDSVSGENTQKELLKLSTYDETNDDVDPVDEDVSARDNLKKRMLDFGDEEDDEGDEKVIGKRRKVLEDNYDPEKIRRKKLRDYYTKTPTSIMILNLVFGKHGSKLPLDIIWQSILGLTDQYLRNHITEESYEQYCQYLRGELHDHMTNLKKREYTVSDGDVHMSVAGSESGNIKETMEYRFYMHRHWSLFDAMYHSPYIASKLKVWQTSGKNQLQELLAQIGLPLHQSNQSYNFIPPNLRKQFQYEISEISSKKLFNLGNPDVLYRSFIRFNAFKNPVAATDIVLAATALLEKSSSSPHTYKENINNQNTPINRNNEDSTPSTSKTDSTGDDDDGPGYESYSSKLEAYNQAYDCLGMKSNDLFKKGASLAIDLQKMLVKKAAILLEDHSDLIVRFSRFYYCRIDSHTNISAISSLQRNNGQNTNKSFGDKSSDIDEPFTRPHVLTRLGQFVMDVKRNLTVRQGGWSGASLLPLIMLSQKKSTGTFVVVGISPLQSNIVEQTIQEKYEHRLHILTNFRQLFQFAADESKARYWNDSFDTNIVEVHQDDITDFLGELNDIMKRATSTS